MPISMRPASRVLVLFSLAVLCLAPVSARSASHLAGVGIMITADADGSVWIHRVLPGGPAERAGVRDGDELLAVGGRSVTGMPLGQIAAMVRGQAGSTIMLTVRAREGRSRRLTMRRERLSVGSTTGRFENSTSTPGYEIKPTQPALGRTLRFRRVAIRDPAIGNRVAVSFLVPETWTVRGGVRWVPNYSILANLLLRIRDPRSGAELQTLPAQNFVWLSRSTVPMARGTNYFGDIVWPPITDIPQFIRIFYASGALKHLQDARQVSVQRLPAVAAAVANSVQARYAVAARVRYAYMRNGRPWREDVFVTLVYHSEPMGTIWTVNAAYAVRAPSDQFARLEPVMLATVGSRHISLDWFASYRYVQRLFENRMGKSVKDAADISRMVARNSEEISRMYEQSYDEASASWNRINRQFSEYIRGVQRYNDPYKGHAVELPSGYQHAWVNANGEYLLSNNANFNPNVGSNVEWKRMKGGDEH